MERYPLDLTWVVKNRECDYEVGASNEKYYLWWLANVAYGNLTHTGKGWNLENYLLKSGFMCLLDLLTGKGQGWDTFGIASTLFRDCC